MIVLSGTVRTHQILRERYEICIHDEACYKILAWQREMVRSDSAFRYRAGSPDRNNRWVLFFRWMETSTIDRRTEKSRGSTEYS